MRLDESELSAQGTDVKKSEPPSPEEFDRMLDWLDPDRNLAGEKYELIRTKLIKIGARRGCYEAEEMADEAINRVSHKVKDIAPTYVGDPALYFYGVLRKVLQEWFPIDPPVPNPNPVYPPDSDEEKVYKERMYEFLERCLNGLDPADRDLILQYFRERGRAKINCRQQIADKLGITLNSLRMKVHRLNARLRKCINDLLDALNKK